MGKKILIVDDEVELVETLAVYLREAGYIPIEAYNGETALASFRDAAPALILLDLGLPDMSGLDVAREIRRTSQVPLIMLTARSLEVDRIVGLELGADDYITKPFSPREVILRIQSVLRRFGGLTADETLHVGDLIINVAAREVRRGTTLLTLTPIEFVLLRFLARQPNCVFTRRQLMEGEYGRTTPAPLRSIDNHVMNLRRKIELDPCNPQYLKTVYGVGYKLTLDLAVKEGDAR